MTKGRLPQDVEQDADDPEKYPENPQKAVHRSKSPLRTERPGQYRGEETSQSGSWCCRGITATINNQ